MFENKEYVYMVYQEKSFSKAAKKMYVTQPCLSAMVKKVEKKIGAPIFNRNVTPIQLTDCGKMYIEYIEQVMQMEQQFENYLCDIRGLKIGSIAIGANNVCSSFVLPDIMRRFSSEYPDIQLQLHEGNIDYLNEQMQLGALDVILDNYPVEENLYEVYPMRKEEILVAVPLEISQNIDRKYHCKGITAEDVILGKHKNSRRKKISFQYFEECPFIILRKGNDTRNRYEQLCQETEIVPSIVLEVDQLSTAYNIACSGTGASLVSDTLIQKMPPAGQLRYYSVASKITQRALFFHYPKNRYLSLAMKKFMESAAEK
ncbi:MAG: LysR family transcriptional regulator [Lachnospiraceae bacterium]|nr:LysR family transcriptional regulator [Lachnospiraceae bacterium]